MEARFFSTKDPLHTAMQFVVGLHGSVCALTVATIHKLAQARPPVLFPH